MGRFLSVVSTLVVLAAAVAPDESRAAVIPDDYPTIQSAIAAGEPLVKVRGWVAPERITVTNDVTIEPMTNAGIGHPVALWTHMPSIQSMEVGPGERYEIKVRGMRFLGELDLGSSRGGVVFESCRLDSGFSRRGSVGQGWETSVRGCLLFGDAVVRGAYTQFVGNTVIGGGAYLWSDGLHDIRNNYIRGPAAVGMELRLYDSLGPVEGNTIGWTDVGIRVVENNGGAGIRRNTISDCAGDGIIFTFGQYSTAGCFANIIERCGGAGIVARSTGADVFLTANLTGNVIRQTGLAGIDLESTYAYPIDGNVVLDAGADGIKADFAIVKNNIVGRSGGHGIHVTLDANWIAGNTVFSNAGAGIRLAAGGLQVDNNISVFNGGPGLEFEGTCHPDYCDTALACNDWYANAGGATVGVLPGPTDLSVHPQFCDLGSGDAHLAAGSPLLGAPGCGLIGALGQGCGPITGVAGWQEMESEGSLPSVAPRRRAAGPSFQGEHGSPMGALPVVVPDDYPSIQSALDAGAALIRLRDGLVPERLTVRSSVTIEPMTHQGEGGIIDIWTYVPSIQSLEIDVVTPDEECDINVRGVRFRGEVDLGAAPGGHDFESCRFDSGMVRPGRANPAFVTSIRACMFLGDVNIKSAYTQFTGNSVIGGGAVLWSDGNHDIRNNYVHGPAAAALELRVADSDGRVEGNTIRGTTDGIRFEGNDGGTVVIRNDIADCSGDGIAYYELPYGSAHCDSNLVARCGGAGIVIKESDEYSHASARLAGNTIRETGSGGIDLPRTTVSSAQNNMILDAGGDGFRAWLVVSFENNVIGRSRGTGLRLLDGFQHVSRNTIFSNAGPGIHSSGSTPGSLAGNISVFNGGPGLLFETTCPPQYCGPPELSCNDWFGNAGGGSVGVSPDYSDLSVNPRFCDLGAGNVRLSASSPLLDDPNCGQIGALGQGCSSTTGVEDAVARPMPMLHARPNPARGYVSFVLNSSAVEADLEVFDVLGARRWETSISAGAIRVLWDRRGTNGRPAPPGVYFARLTRGGKELARVRIVLAD